MRTFVYVAGPINGSGKQNRNVREACLVAERLIQADYGVVPFVPHLNVLWDTICPDMETDDWLEWDLAWLGKCDALLRLPGVSPGSDGEVAYARAHGIEVFTEVGVFLYWAMQRHKGEGK